MDNIKSYLLCVVGTALICAVCRKIMDSVGTNQSLVRLVTGIVLSVAMLSPVFSFRTGSLQGIWESYYKEARECADYGVSLSRNELSQRINQECVEYVLKEAQKLDVDAKVEVTLSKEDIPAPESVRIQASASPFARTALIQTVSEAFGLDKEKIQWI